MEILNRTKRMIKITLFRTSGINSRNSAVDMSEQAVRATEDVLTAAKKVPNRKVVNNDRDCDIIEVGDSDEEESPPLPSTSRRTTRSTAQLSDQFKLCEFPPGAQDLVSVCVQDFKSLEHDTFLNDIIVNFYLTYRLHKVLPPEERTLVHMFSTMFYKRLTQSKAKEEQGLSSAQKKHSRVDTWTKNVNIFRLG